MLQFQRLTMDSSWHFSWEEAHFLADPWLLGSEIDGFRWLNEQWHTTPPVSPESLPDYAGILISQSYQDHLHPQTLAQLRDDVPLLATEKAAKKLSRLFPGRRLMPIPHWSEKSPLQWQNLQWMAFAPPHRRDPVYYAVLIANADRKAIFYAPHGFHLSEADRVFLQDWSVQVLMTTLTEFALPAWMGGKVNPGLDNALELARVLRPHHLLNTHDEDKLMKGLVARLAKVQRPDWDHLPAELPYRPTPDYAPYSFDF
ncbi:MAG: hypothetical protein OHK0053_10430 [Microscillaceae bacterium]